MTQPIKLNIGDIINVHDQLEHSSVCHRAIVLDINEYKIKVGFRDYGDATNKWIDTKISTIDIGKSSIDYVDCKVFGRDCIPPDPCYYNNQIIISIDGHDQMSPGIYSYCIENDKCTKIATYPDGFSLDRHGMAVDAINDDIYLFGGRSKVFGIYNILNKTWNIQKNDDMPDIRYPTSIYIASPFDELYFMGINEDINNSMLSIIKYCKKQNDSKYSLVNILSNFPFPDKLKYGDMVYDEERQRMILFGGTDDDKFGDDNIWVYDISKQNEKNKEWHLLSVKLPHHGYSSSIKPIYAFGSVIFVLYLDERYKEIWCLELLSNEWFKSHLNLAPNKLQGDIVKTNDNYLHFLYYDNDAYHIKMNLQDMIPTHLYRFYSNFYQSLIYGYIRINIEQIYKYHVSNDLKQIISKFWNALL